MMKYTLLEIVQDVHNDLNLDLVNTIGDTPDSLRVAQIAKTVYFEFINRRDWPHLSVLGRLDSLVDLTQKTGLSLPEAVSRLEWINYNKRKTTDTKDKYEKIDYLSPEEFLHRANNRDSNATNTEYVTTPSGVSFLIRNDIPPQYYTSFDDNIIYFDAFDSSVETTIQGIKTQAKLYKEASWITADDAVPFLPTEAFPGYIAEVKSVASIKIKELQDSKAEQQSVRQQRRLSNQAWRSNSGIVNPNYGRRTKGSWSSSRLLEK